MEFLISQDVNWARVGLGLYNISYLKGPWIMDFLILQDVNWARAGLGLPLLDASAERKPGAVPVGMWAGQFLHFRICQAVGSMQKIFYAFTCANRPHLGDGWSPPHQILPNFSNFLHFRRAEFAVIYPGAKVLMIIVHHRSRQNLFHKSMPTCIRPVRTFIWSLYTPVL